MKLITNQILLVLYLRFLLVFNTTFPCPFLTGRFLVYLFC